MHPWEGTQWMFPDRKFWKRGDMLGFLDPNRFPDQVCSLIHMSSDCACAYTFIYVWPLLCLCFMWNDWKGRNYLISLELVNLWHLPPLFKTLQCKLCAFKEHFPHNIPSHLYYEERGMWENESFAPVSVRIKSENQKPFWVFQLESIDQLRLTEPFEDWVMKGQQVVLGTLRVQRWSFWFSSETQRGWGRGSGCVTVKPSCQQTTQEPLLPHTVIENKIKTQAKANCETPIFKLYQGQDHSGKKPLIFS